MSTKGPRVQQPKTECPMCGNVWQEHTINESNGCEALIKLHLSVGLARDAKLQGKAGQPSVEICPVCSKTSDEHTEPDLILCAAKWRKRQRGSTGFKLQHRFLEANSRTKNPIR